MKYDSGSARASATAHWNGQQDHDRETDVIAGGGNSGGALVSTVMEFVLGLAEENR